MEGVMQASFSSTALSTKVGVRSLHESSDDELMPRISAGDRHAMEVLYVRHHVRVYRFLLRLVNNSANAEDLTSEVFLDTWKHAGRFEGRSQVST
jgi:RNA polymerase sigma-70 factor, ECF subfamily